mgnify:FL=1|tara:strand:- start:294 stop:515 length:222 start_codon:yes stop_codon:yes gene_type:complete
MSSGQSFTGSTYQNNNLIISSGNSVVESSISVGQLFSDFLRNNIDTSFGQVDISGNLSINNGNVLVNNNIMIG